MIRADYIHSDLYASLGRATLDRAPVAFLADHDRPSVSDLPLVRHLPPAMSLKQVGTLLAQR